MDYQCYFDGDFWYATGSVGPGESPERRPDLWRRIKIPAMFARVLTMRMLAGVHESEGQFDKALSVKRQAELVLDELRVTANQPQIRQRRVRLVYD